MMTEIWQWLSAPYRLPVATFIFGVAVGASTLFLLLDLSHRFRVLLFPRHASVPSSGDLVKDAVLGAVKEAERKMAESGGSRLPAQARTSAPVASAATKTVRTVDNVTAAKAVKTAEAVSAALPVPVLLVPQPPHHVYTYYVRKSGRGPFYFLRDVVEALHIRKADLPDYVWRKMSWDKLPQSIRDKIDRRKEGD